MKMVKAKSGQMYDADSPQGQMIVNSATTGPDATFDKSSSRLGADSGMAETLQLIYGETQESSESLDNIEESLVDDGRETAEERAARLDKSNKDKTSGNKFGKGLGFVKDKIGAGASKLKSSLAGKFGLALLGGALLLLNQYGDEIAGPKGWLTKFLKYMKENLIPDIKALYEDLQLWWDDAWVKVKGFFTYIEGIFTKIGAYMDTFDTDKSTPGLDADEREKMVEDLTKRAGEFVGKMFTSMVSSVGNAIFTGVLLASGIGLAKSALIGSGLFAKTGTLAATTGKSVGAMAALRSMKVGVGGYLAIGLMVAGGVAAMFDASTRAATAALDEGIKTGTNGDWTTWTSSFLAGGEGGWDNAFANTKEKGMMGAGIGSLLGVPFGPAGMLLGGMIGALAGGLFGAVTGKIGAPRMKKALEGVESVIDQMGDSILAHANGIAQAVLAIVPGGETMSEAYLKGTSIVQKRNLRNRGEVISALENAKAGNISFSGAMDLSDMELATGKASKANIALEMAFLQEKLAKIDKQILMSPDYAHSEKVAKQMGVVRSLQNSMNLGDLKRELVENPFERFAKAQKMLATAPRLPDGEVQTKGRYKGSTLDIKKLFDRGDGDKLDFLFDADMGQEVFFQRQYPEYAARPDVKTAGGAFEIYRNFAENTSILDAEKTKLTDMQAVPAKFLLAQGQAMLNKVMLMEELIKENPSQYNRKDGIVIPIAPDNSSNTTISNANYISNMQARSDFYATHDILTAALKN
tara:strand:+ start:53 stop:2305 length:2253 start_codon:yes stop_codon:yes gene_type:complete